MAPDIRPSAVQELYVAGAKGRTTHAGAGGKKASWQGFLGSSRRLLWRTLLVAVAVPAMFLAASPASASVVHDKDSWFDVTGTEHDFNICGDLATFNFESTGHVITTETESGFHFTSVNNYVYTVDFDDPSLGTWTARATETSTFNATPGDVITLHVGNNNIEGDVRIRELMTLIIGPGGDVRVDRTTFEVVGC